MSHRGQHKDMIKSRRNHRKQTDLREVQLMKFASIYLKIIRLNTLKEVKVRMVLETITRNQIGILDLKMQ